MNLLPGIGGTLFPGRYIADRLAHDSTEWTGGVPSEDRRRQFERWWTSVAAVCGPASGPRALFDLVAMPLFGMLGFRAHDAEFGFSQSRVRLETRLGASVGCVLLPWAARLPSLWRDASATAREVSSSWCFIVAPPFLSIVDARGHAWRHSVDFTFPDAFDARSFSPFWMLCRSDAFDRVGLREPGAPARIEALVESGVVFQDWVRDDLQAGISEALGALGRAIAHRRQPVRGRTTAPTDSPHRPPSTFDQALTLVYRILFLLFAESRDLVPRTDPIYGRAYAIGALARDALRHGPRPGLWEGLAAITRLSRLGCRTDDLIVRPFNGRLFARRAAPALEDGRTSRRPGRRSWTRDAAMQGALVALTTRRGRAGREEITYQDLGVEQLGAVYERVLDLDPDVAGGSIPSEVADPHLERRPRRHSQRRKQTGTFYTPQPLAEFVVRRTLAPLVAGALPQSILSLRVVDPAMGSGAFVVAACRYLAAAYERALIEEGSAAATDFDENERANIRRLVAERCLAGVDRNPVAVQLARLSLWLTTLARGKPLSFLDHRLRVGDSLIGASPDDLHHIWSRPGARGAADLPLFADGRLEDTIRAVAKPLGELRSRRDDTVSDVRAKEALWQRLLSGSSPLHQWRVAANLWCARWFWPGGARRAPAASELRALLDSVLKSDRTLRSPHLAERLSTASEVASKHWFFHWPLEFADAFYDEAGQPRRDAGFDAVIGNPPWEMLRLERHTKAEGPASNREPAAAWSAGALEPRQLVRFVRESHIYPTCGRGHINLYQPFLERSLAITRRGGRIGLVLPWGLAVDDGAAELRRKLFGHSAVDTLVGLDNAERLFPIHRGLRFLVVCARNGAPTSEIRARFGVKTAAELDALPGRDESVRQDAYPVRLTPAQLASIGGSTMRVPDLRRPEDLHLVTRLIARFPPLGSREHWAAEFGRELNATEDRGSFGPAGLPVIEGKHVSPFRVDTTGVTARIGRAQAYHRLRDGRFDRPRLGYRDVSGVANRQSLIAAIVPAGVVTTHTIFCLRSPVPLERQHFLCGLFNSFVLNAVVRLLMGGHVTTTLVEGLPVPPWREGAHERRIAELARSCFEHGISEGSSAQLQAGVAHLYGLSEIEFSRVLDGFPLVPKGERERAAGAFAALLAAPNQRDDQQ